MGYLSAVNISQSRVLETADPDIGRDVKKFILYGLAVIVLILGGFSGWAITAPLTSAVIAPGVIVVDSSRKRIQHYDGGVVHEILVRNGTYVEKDEVLLRLDETRARASLTIVQSALESARILEARLIAERDEAPLDFPADLKARDQDSSLANMIRAQQLIFEARRASFTGQQSILRQRVAQYQQEIVGLTAQQRALDRQIYLIEDELKGLQFLLDKGFTQRTRVLALQREVARLQGERGERIAEIARAHNTIGGTQLEILQIDKKFREDVVAEIRNTQAQISDLSERVSASRHLLDHVEIRAPVSGIVVGLEAHTIGGVIRPGDTILEIVPAEDRLVVEAQVHPMDIDMTTPGQEAEVRLTGMKQRTTPTLIGQITYISADRLTDNRTGAPYYLARVEVTERELSRLAGSPIQPGMPADVMIKTAERTVFQYLMQPLSDAMAKAWRED